jgi:hypothetical protein
MFLSGTFLFASALVVLAGNSETMLTVHEWLEVLLR